MDSTQFWPADGQVWMQGEGFCNAEIWRILAISSTGLTKNFLADGPLLGDADGWRGGVRATTFRRRRGWDGMARSRLPARGCRGDDVVWPMAAGRRPGDGGWAAGQKLGHISIFM